MFNDMSLSQYLDGQPSDRQLALASFFVTNPKALAKLKAQWALRNPQHSAVLGRTIDELQVLLHEDFGGSLALLDPVRLEAGFIDEFPVPSAFGMCVNEQDNSLYVTSDLVLLKIKSRRCTKVLNNSLFNDLHTCTLSVSGNLLVVSTGIDAILEVAFEDASVVCWDWLATEHGYTTTPAGQSRVIDRRLNYQLVVTTTPEHTTHINTALNDCPDRILATLFHQGDLIEIDRPSKQSRVLLSGLMSPHNIRCRRDGFMVSDTRANRVLLLDHDFRVERELTGEFDWVQDAVELKDELLYLVADSNMDRLVLIDRSSNIQSVLQWPKHSRKIAGLELITLAQARHIFLPT
jgi:hypothetical protein